MKKKINYFYKKEEFKINYLKDEYNNKIIKVNSIEYDVK